MQVEFTKPEGGGLGFALIGGTNGSLLRVKEICSGGVAEQDGRLKVGDIVLEVTTQLAPWLFYYPLSCAKTLIPAVPFPGKRSDCVGTEPQ